MSDTPAISGRDVVKRYGELTAVAGISFEVARGECFGFLGPNGAGKTTTMRMLYGACGLTSGSLLILGRDVGTDLRAIKSRLGVVPQEDSLDTELTVIENLVVFARYFGLKGRAAVERADHLLAFFQLEAKREAKVEMLSGGMKRRLVTARALIAEPDMLILDEPTTGLDPAARHLLWQKLRQLKRQGTTVVLTTHYMDEAQRLCDRLVVIDHGKIIAEGTPAELIARHVGKDVVEVVLDSDETERVAAALGAAGEKVEHLPDMLLCYTQDTGATRAALAKAGVPAGAAFERRGSLEDVFLRLTGRRLSD